MGVRDMTLLANATAAIFVLDGTTPAPTEAETAARLFPQDVRWTVSASIQDHPAHTSGATGFASDVLSPDEMETRSRADRIDADGALAATARGLGNRPVRQVAERGDVVENVMELLAAQRIDVVVAATSDVGEQLVDGGVPRVLVVPQSRTDVTGSVLIAMDDPSADTSLTSTVAALVGPDAECIALHIAQLRPVANGTGVGGVAASVALQGDLDRDAERPADDAPGVRVRDVTPSSGVGSPVGGILDAAQEHGAALIVLGTKDRGWLARLLRASVPDAVLHRAQRPVLVVSGSHGVDRRVAS